jgi:hypothetical protein
MCWADAYRQDTVGVRGVNDLGSPVVPAATAFPSEVETLGIDERDEVEVQPAEGSDLAKCAPANGNDARGAVERDVLLRSVGDDVTKKDVDIEDGTLLGPSRRCP